MKINKWVTGLDRMYIHLGNENRQIEKAEIPERRCMGRISSGEREQSMNIIPEEDASNWTNTPSSRLWKRQNGKKEIQRQGESGEYTCRRR